MSEEVEPDSFPASLERYARLMREFEEESDRGCAILMLCALEEALVGLFQALVVEGQPIDTLGTRAGGIDRAIDRARALGLMKKEEAECFKHLSRIRNRFAHHVTERLRFTEPSIQRQIEATPYPFPPTPGVDLDADAGPRMKFMMRAASLNSLLLFRRKAVSRLRQL